MQQRYIPKHLDSQPQFLWWELDEAMILFAFLIAGRLVDNMLLFTVLGFVAYKVYSKLKRSRQPGFIKHKLYALGLVKFKSNLVKSNKIPAYYIKYFVK